MLPFSYTRLVHAIATWPVYKGLCSEDSSDTRGAVAIAIGYPQGVQTDQRDYQFMRFCDTLPFRSNPNGSIPRCQICQP